MHTATTYVTLYDKIFLNLLSFYLLEHSYDRKLTISVRSHSTQVELSRFLTTDLKSIFTDWLETTWNDFNLVKRSCLFDNFLRVIANIIQANAICLSNAPDFVISTLISRNVCDAKISKCFHFQFSIVSYSFSPKVYLLWNQLQGVSVQTRLK